MVRVTPHIHITYIPPVSPVYPMLLSNRAGVELPVDPYSQRPCALQQKHFQQQASKRQCLLVVLAIKLIRALRLPLNKLLS